MRWRTGALAVVVVSTAALSFWGGAASAASRYAFADSCQTLRVGGGTVNRAALGG